MLKIEDALTYLKEKINVETDSVEFVWSTYKELGDEDFVDNYMIDLIVSWDIDDYKGEEMLRLTLQRVFTLYENGEPADADKERIRCELHFTLTEELKDIECTEWSMDYEGFNVFFEYVEKLNCFNMTSKIKPHSINIYQADF